MSHQQQLVRAPRPSPLNQNPSHDDQAAGYGKVAMRKGVKQAQLAPFLQHLWAMLSDPAHSKIITFVAGQGTDPNQANGFAVFDPKEFEAQVLPKYFKHNKFASFCRQLNTYNFERRRGNETNLYWHWTHPFLNRSRKDLLFHIKRKDKKVNPDTLSMKSKTDLIAEIQRLQTRLEDHEGRLVDTEKDLFNTHQRQQTSDQRMDSTIKSFRKVFGVLFGEMQPHVKAKIAAALNHSDVNVEDTAMMFPEAVPLIQQAGHFSPPPPQSSSSSSSSSTRPHPFHSFSAEHSPPPEPSQQSNFIPIGIQKSNDNHKMGMDSSSLDFFGNSGILSPPPMVSMPSIDLPLQGSLNLLTNGHNSSNRGGLSISPLPKVEDFDEGLDLGNLGDLSAMNRDFNFGSSSR